ncbi:uncharacterized protein LOC119579715 [Penaeus monodon]|uniref:uncharacterized protein LOC119579715 n=1 Tax=Penaeus monodon TaxID=6687 RepID=UPI0018A79E09|nr:uncharacterized protein LOC119579715 [Penaeus monodon]
MFIVQIIHYILASWSRAQIPAAAVATCLRLRTISRLEGLNADTGVDGPKANDSSKVVAQESKAMELQECDVRGAVVADKGKGAVLTSWAAEDLGKKGDNYMSFVKRVRHK